MKKLFIILCCLFYSFSLLLAVDKQYTIKGTVGGLDAPAKAYLISSLDDQFSIDSCIVKNGSFIFTGTAEYPFPARIVFSAKGDGLQSAMSDVITFYVDSGIIEINAVNSLSDVKIFGSATTDLYVQHKQVLDSIREQVSRLQTTYQNRSTNELQATQFTDSINNEFEKLKTLYANATLNFIEKHPQSILGVYLLQYELSGNLTTPTIELAYNRLSQEIRNTNPGIKLATLIETYKPLSVGQTVPDLTMNDITGKAVSVSDYRGKYLLLVFWSPDCDHCKNEIPYLVKNYNLFKDKNFSIMGVAIESEEKRQQWVDSVIQNNMEWANVSDLKLWNSPIFNRFKVRSVPFNYLIDPNGKVIAVQLRGNNLTKVLNETIP